MKDFTKAEEELKATATVDEVINVLAHSEEHVRKKIFVKRYTEKNESE